MKGKIMKNVTVMLFAFFLVLIHMPAWSMGDTAKSAICMPEIGQNKICYDLNFLETLKKSPPREYKKISEYTSEILSNFPEDCVILEMLTDNMVSYATLLFINSDKHLPKTKYDGDRIHIITLNNRDFTILKFLESGLEKFSMQKSVNVYSILNRPSPSPRKYLLLKTHKKTISITGSSLLSSEILYKLKNRDDFGSLYFWYLFISYLETTDKYEAFKSFEL